MKATLKRIKYSKQQTLGQLTIIDGDGKEVFRCDTLELPWKNNKNRISCIPEGQYKAVFRNFGNYANRSFHIQTREGKEVEGRTGILIHSGNFFTDTRGCILLGRGYADIAMKTKRRTIKKDGILDILHSRKTMDELLNLSDEFGIEITGNVTDLEEVLLEEDEIVPIIENDFAYVNVNSSLNLRKEPNRESDILDTLLNDQEVIVKEKEGEWVKIQILLSIEGWVSKKYMKTNEQELVVNTNGGMLNIRKEPSVDSEKVLPDGIKNKTKLYSLQERENWVKVRLIGLEGYVYQDFLQK